MKAVDLFAGCGGLSLGFEQAGVDIAAAFEMWDVAVNCYRENFDHDVFTQDLSDVEAAIDTIQRFDPDIIIGGPPCQDFSNAGKHVEAERANLTVCFSQIVSGIRPKCFVMENVAQARNSKAYARARENLKNAGYGLTEIVLNASLCGVPQNRRRFFCFGMQNQKDGFATEAFQAGLSKKPLTVKEYFGDSLNIEYYYRHPRTYGSRAIYSVDEPSATIRGVNPKIPTTYKDHVHPKDACPVTPELRSLTYQERAKIQTFPDTFIWVGKRADVEKMIGNAVPVKLGKYVADVVVKTINQEKRTQNQSA